MKKILLLTMLLLCGCAKETLISGPTGTSGVQGIQGTSGAPGQNGINGLTSLLSVVSGASGCVNGGVTILTGLDQNADNILETNEVTSSAEVCDGVNGTNGTNGQNAPPTAFTPVAIVNPCGDAPGIYDEVFIRLQNGTLIASFSDNANGKNTRFSVLVPGSYITTDGDNCTFTVDANGNITNENHQY